MTKILIMTLYISNMIYAGQDSTPATPKDACPNNNASQVGDLQKRFEALLKANEASKVSPTSSVDSGSDTLKNQNHQ